MSLVQGNSFGGHISMKLLQIRKFFLKFFLLISGIFLGYFFSVMRYHREMFGEQCTMVRKFTKLEISDANYNEKIEATGTLPQGFVYLKDIDPTIQQSPRYETTENFLGRSVKGYRKGTGIVLARQAAEALKRVQEQVGLKGYELVVYDGYRPQKAVNDFIAWAKDYKDQIKKIEYYPEIKKEDLFRFGYVAVKSGHSRGSSVDLTLIKKGEKVQNPVIVETTLTDGSILKRLDDGTLYMGTSFDFFDKASWTNSSLVDEEAQKNRAYLARVMNDAGFDSLLEEWWYFILQDEPFPKTYFDFEF